MKIKYNNVRSLFEEIRYCVSSQARLLYDLIEHQDKKNPGFWDSMREVVKQRHELFCWSWWTVIFALLAGVLFCTRTPKDLGEWELLEVSKAGFLLAVGIGLGAIIVLSSRSNLTYTKCVDRFLEALGEVLCAIIEYQKGVKLARLPIGNVRWILKTWSVENLRGATTPMLIDLAFHVKRLEGTRPETDRELKAAREHCKSIHAYAVMLGVAEKNPQTYFDRAVPAVATV